MQKYQKAPVVIEAIQLTKKNKDEVKKILVGVNPLQPKNFAGFVERSSDPEFLGVKVMTEQGIKIAEESDYVVKNEAGEFSICPAKEFEAAHKEIK